MTFYSILHLFPWSGVINDDFQLSDTFRVPDPKTGQMRRLTSQIPQKEEEMFRNMIRRVNTIVKVSFCNLKFPSFFWCSLLDICIGHFSDC